MTTNICLGTAAIGRPVYINIKQEPLNSSFDLDKFKSTGIEFIDFAYKSGIKHFDTSPSYGAAEQMLHEWLINNKHADAVFSSKWGYSYEANFKEDAKLHEHKEHSISRLIEQWENTKKVLPNIKLYQIHSATLESGVFDNHEVLKKLKEIKEELKIEIGFTTTGANQNAIIDKALSIETKGEQLFTSVQATYNVFDQSLHKIIAKAKQNNLKIIVKESLANGRIFKNENFTHYNTMYSVLYELSRKYNVGNDAIALRFVIDTIAPENLLIGATNKVQLESNVKCLSFKLLNNEIEKIKELSVSPEFYWKERSALNWN